jgi:regulatory protein
MQQAYERAIKYLARRPRSKQEVVKYLSKKGFEPDEVQATVDRLEASRFLGDHQFADIWIQNRQLLKPRSRRQLEVELRDKGVEAEALESALNEFSREDEISAASQIIQKKLKLDQYQDQSKLIAYLARQGFSYDTIKAALEKLN